MAFFVQGRTPTITRALIALTLAFSLLAAIDARRGGLLWLHLALQPDAVLHGQIWRLVTWPFVIGHPLALVFTCVAIYSFGSALLATWGRRRYLRYLGGLVLAVGVATSLLSLVLPGALWLPHLGGMVLLDALVIAWARQFPDHPVSIYFVLTVSGRALVSIITAVTLVFAVYVGITWMMPELLTIAAALLYMDRPHRRWWLQLRLYRAHRRLRVVSPHR